MKIEVEGQEVVVRLTRLEAGIISTTQIPGAPPGTMTLSRLLSEVMHAYLRMVREEPRGTAP